MNLPVEMMHEKLPMAAAEIAGIDMAVFVGAAAVVGAAATARKITPHWHETITEGNRGVLLHRGQPVEKKVISPFKYKIHDFVPDRMREFEHRYLPRRGHFVTENQLEEGEGKYVILPPDWYFVGPFNSIQPINIADHPAEIKTTFEAPDGKGGITKLESHIEIASRVNPTGDNPFLAMTQIQHEMVSKKDSGEDTKVKQEKNINIKNQRVTGLAATGLTRAIGELGLDSDSLCKLINSKELTKKIEDGTVEQSRQELAKYGLEITSSRLVAIRRVGEEVLGDKLGNSSLPPRERIVVANTTRIPPDEDGKGEVIPLFPGGDAA